MAEAKKAWRHRRRVYRPGQPTPGEHLIIEGTTEGGLARSSAPCALEPLAFVHMATDQKAPTTVALLAESSRSWAVMQVIHHLSPQNTDHVRSKRRRA